MNNRIELEKVTKDYGSTRALDGITLAIPSGQIRGLVGENGAGKSTLAKIIAGDIRPTSGMVKLNGAEVPYLTPTSARRAGIAIVHQWGDLVPAMTVEENIFLGNEIRGQFRVLNKSEIALPLIEQKIEEVLRSRSVSSCFNDKSVDPKRFVGRAMLAIATAGDLEALKQSSKLIKIDEKRFGDMVDRTLSGALGYRNPFTVAYQGLELNDPVLDSRIGDWARAQLRERTHILPGAAEAETLEVREWLAQAVVKRYGAAPSEKQWAKDPLISRLPPLLTAGLHDHVMSLAAEAAKKSPTRR